MRKLLTFLVSLMMIYLLKMDQLMYAITFVQNLRHNLTLISDNDLNKLYILALLSRISKKRQNNVNNYTFKKHMIKKD